MPIKEDPQAKPSRSANSIKSASNSAPDEPKKPRTSKTQNPRKTRKAPPRQKPDAPDVSVDKNSTVEALLQSENLKQLAEKAAEELLGPNPIVGFGSRDILDTAKMVLGKAITQPRLLVKHESNFAGHLVRTIIGKSDLKPDKGDHRFSDPTWSQNWLYRAAKQIYLARRKEWHAWIDDLKLPVPDADRAHFVVSLLTEALSPTNTLLNPVALKRILETGGMSLVKGLKHLASDIVNEGGMPSQVDKSAFAVGKNLATTEGCVVFRSEVLELIQYNPMNAQVYKRPMLLVPPQINKFYVFDLSPEKSLVRHLLNGGQRVFIISWRNPTPEQREWGLETYVQAIEEAINVVCEISGSNDCNITGACSGGVTTLVSLAYLSARGNKSIYSLTLLVCVFDTNTKTQLGLFASDTTLELARKASASRGVLEGRDMAKVFAWMRPNDLVWNYWVNNYLLGNEPPAFDILYWNADTTRLPAKFHGELLDLFKHNPLVTANGISICDTPIDLSQVACDLYALAGVTDHITPWKACYQSTHLMGAQCEFVLSSSGHIQSILNPPGNPKARFFTNPVHPADTEQWIAGATENQGSWWDHWLTWLSRRSGRKIKASKSLGSAVYTPLEKAPGTYVYK